MSTVNVTGTLKSGILNQVKRLFTTPVNSVPFNRSFGVDLSKLDNVQTATEGALIAEYALKLKTFFPDLKIAQISFETEDQTLIPTVVIENG